METVLHQSKEGAKYQWSIVQNGYDVVMRVNAVGEVGMGLAFWEFGFSGDVLELGWENIWQKVLDRKGAIVERHLHRNPFELFVWMLEIGLFRPPSILDYIRSAEFNGIYCKDKASKYLGKFLIANMGKIDKDAAFVAVRDKDVDRMLNILALSQIYDLNMMLTMDGETILLAYIRILDAANIICNECPVNVHFLLAMGVDPAARNRVGQTARDVAKQMWADLDSSLTDLKSRLRDMEALSVLEPDNDDLQACIDDCKQGGLGSLEDGIDHLGEVVDILRSAEEERWRALAPHRLAAAMATHRRLGAASPLAAVDPGLLRAALLADAPAA